MYLSPGEPNGETKLKDGLHIMPSYLTHPPFPYLPGSSSYRPSDPAPTVSAGQKTPHLQPHLPGNTPPQTNGPCLDENGNCVHKILLLNLKLCLVF